MDEAIGHYQELLRLNQNANQVNRALLAVCLIAAGRDAEARVLLARYHEGITFDWLYTAALLAFRMSGAGPDASHKLHNPIEHNPYVTGYLLGRKRMPRQLPPHYSIGNV